MGVSGLLSFINRNVKNCFSEMEWKTGKNENRGCPLIVDGNAFMYSVYRKHLNWTFGGEYHEYEKLVKLYLEIFDSIGFKLTFVFDGCCSSEKMPTQLNRMIEKKRAIDDVKMRIEQGKSAESHDQLLPPLCYAVLHSVLEKNRIPMIFSDTEADRIIASIANSMDGYVLSNDSDFLIFPLSKGYIPLNTLSSPLIRQGFPCTSFSIDSKVTARVYRSEDIAKRLLISPCHMNLLSCAIGNDYFDGFLLDSVIGISPNTSRITSVIKFFRRNREKSVEDILGLHFRIQKNALKQALLELTLIQDNEVMFKSNEYPRNLKYILRNGTFNCAPIIGDSLDGSSWEITKSIRHAMFSLIAEETIEINFNNFQISKTLYKFDGILRCSELQTEEKVFSTLKNLFGVKYDESLLGNDWKIVPLIISLMSKSDELHLDDTERKKILLALSDNSTYSHMTSITLRSYYLSAVWQNALFHLHHIVWLIKCTTGVSLLRFISMPFLYSGFKFHYHLNSSSSILCDENAVVVNSLFQQVLNTLCSGCEF